MGFDIPKEGPVEIEIGGDHAKITAVSKTGLVERVSQNKTVLPSSPLSYNHPHVSFLRP